MTNPIVVVGSINLDLVANSEVIPVPGQTVSGSSFHTFFGGKGANQAVAAAKLGAPVAMLGCVGEDAFGAELIQGLRSAGVETKSVARVPGSSGVALITTDARGENSIVVVPGANAALTPQHLRNYRSLIESAALLLVQLEIPIETVEALAKLAAAHSIPQILDPAPARPIPQSILAASTWITPNETEAQVLSASPSSVNDEVATLAALRSAGATNVILKQGARGVVLCQSGEPPVRLPGFSVKAVDTTAAGDAFNGAFAVGLLRGQSLPESARFANAVAAISVTRAGAQPSMPTQSEVDDFLRRSNALLVGPCG